MKKIISLISMLAICVMMTTLVGCGSDTNSGETTDKKFTFSNYGFEITLTNKFTESVYQDYTIYLESDDITFVGIKETFRALNNTINNTQAEQVTAIDFTTKSLEKNKITATPTQDTTNNWVFYSYTKSNKTYYSYVTKGGTAFWTCQFAFDSSKENQLQADIEKYAKSMKDLDEKITDKEFDNPSVGFTITLLSDFVQSNTSGYEVSLNNNDIVFVAKQYTFESLIEETPNIATLSVNDFAKELVIRLGLPDTAKPTNNSANNWSEFKYTANIDTQSWVYYCYVIKSTDSFWLSRFSCIAEEESLFASDFEKFAKSIVIQ